jgi:hypothetical protein
MGQGLLGLPFVPQQLTKNSFSKNSCAIQVQLDRALVLASYFHVLETF